VHGTIQSFVRTCISAKLTGGDGRTFGSYGREGDSFGKRPAVHHGERQADMFGARWEVDVSLPVADGENHGHSPSSQV